MSLRLELLRGKYHVSDEDLERMKLLPKENYPMTCRVDEEEYMELTKAAFRLRKTKSELIREYLRKYVLSRNYASLLQKKQKKIEIGKIVSFSMDPEEAKQLKILSAEEMIASSKLIRCCIIQIIEDGGKEG